MSKMASGRPLDDTDREPWLKRIRQTALQIVAGGQGRDYVLPGGLEAPDTAENNSKRETLEVDEAEGKHALRSASDDNTHATGSGEQRRLAEVYETSAHDRRPELENQDASLSIKRTGDFDKSGRQSLPRPVASIGSCETYYNPLVVAEQQSANAVDLVQLPPAVIIACSSLKRSYRDFLRGERTSLSDPASPPAPSSQLRTWHLYVDVSAEELLRRMTERKGHFMKEKMLKSQLATLEKPVEGQDEQDILVIQDGEKEQVEKRATQRVKEVLGLA